MSKVINQSINEKFSIYHSDCVEGIKAIPDNSIDYVIYSPPFSSLYTYSASERDMGNSKSNGEFFTHYKFLVAELLRVLKPGRLLSFHCMNLPTSKAHDGYIGIKDFRGDLIRLKQDEGFIYHSEACIWKDPVTAMQRTKALGLLYKQLRKDSAMSRQGIPDYLVTMRKPGENPEPVNHFAADEKGAQEDRIFPVGLWQKFASPIYGEDLPDDCWMPGMMVLKPKSGEVVDNYPEPVWMDINPSETLQFRSAREHADERHICPIQLQVVRRGVKLWTNPNDVVLSPFMGIGSEGYVSIQEGRRFVGFELKTSYYTQSAKNLAAASVKQPNLFED